MAVNSREVLRNGRMVLQYLVQWSDGSSKEASWEDASTLLQEFPYLRLEDKSILQGRESDTSVIEALHEVHENRGCEASC